MTPTRHTADLIRLSHRTSLPTVAKLAVSFAMLVTQWDLRARSRRALASLEAHHLDDLGLTAKQARDEASRPFWRA